MKLRIILRLAVAVTSVAFVGCKKEVEEVKHYTTETSGPTPVLEGFNQLVVNRPKPIAMSEDSEFSVAWSTGDVISVYEADGEWVADLKIKDASAAVSVFAVEDDVRLDDSKGYVAVYPARSADQESYQEYIDNALLSGEKQIQVGESFNHLKEECYMEAKFKGDNPITFIHKKAVLLIQLEGSQAPKSLTFDDGDKYSYTLDIEQESKTKAAAEENFIAYLMVNPTSATEKQILTFAVDNTTTNISTSLGFSEGVLYSVDLADETIVEGAIKDEGGSEGGDTGGENSGSSTEDLTSQDGTWE